MNMPLAEWIGYGASILVVISLMMSSIVRLRWINLAGAACMTAYGILIHAVPVFLLNGFIVIIDLYYLGQIYFARDYFTILQPRIESRYLKRFLEFHQQEIERHLPEFNGRIPDNAMSFFVLRNMVPACLFVGVPEGDSRLNIILDYVIPEYRDFKIGRFLFEEHRTFFPSCGFTHLVTTAGSNRHAAYLKRMGFTETEADGSARQFEKLLPEETDTPCPMHPDCSCGSAPENHSR